MCIVALNSPSPPIFYMQLIVAIPLSSKPISLTRTLVVWHLVHTLLKSCQQWPHETLHSNFIPSTLGIFFPFFLANKPCTYILLPYPHFFFLFAFHLQCLFCLSPLPSWCKFWILFVFLVKCSNVFLLVTLDFWRGIASFKFHHWTTFRQIKGPCIQTQMRFEDFQQFGLKTISFKRTICNEILQLSRWSLNFNAIIILFIYFPSLPQLGTQVGQAFHLLECSVTQFLWSKD